MCGIAGICHIDGPDGISLNTIKSMTGVLHHRGPDEAGVYVDDCVGLGHARLSIRPLYYTIANETLVFGSEVKAIFMNEIVNRQIVLS